MWAARISSAEGSRQLASAAGGADHAIDLAQHIGQAALAHGDGGDDRNAEFARHAFDVDADALALGDVVHVERQHHRAADLLQFQQQPQHQPQIGGIGDADDDIGRRFAGQPAEHEIARDLFVRAAGAQRIGAGQIDDGGAAAGRRRDTADLLFDGDAGIVGNLLARAGERVEQRRLARIGISDQGNQRVAVNRFAHACVRVRLDDQGIGIAAAQRHAGLVDLDGDGIAPDRALMQHFEMRALDKAHLQQAALELGAIDGIGGPRRRRAAMPTIVPRAPRRAAPRRVWTAAGAAAAGEARVRAGQNWRLHHAWAPLWACSDFDSHSQFPQIAYRERPAKGAPLIVASGKSACGRTRRGEMG